VLVQHHSRYRQKFAEIYLIDADVEKGAFYCSMVAGDDEDIVAVDLLRESKRPET
jgi:hypothetical protein